MRADDLRKELKSLMTEIAEANPQHWMLQNWLSHQGRRDVRVKDFRLVTLSISVIDFEKQLTAEQRTALTFFHKPDLVGDKLVWREFPAYRLEEIGLTMPEGDP